jgi:hypothetical protein
VKNVEIVQNPEMRQMPQKGPNPEKGEQIYKNLKKSQKNATTVMALIY